MTAVFGASLGVSGIHGLSVDLTNTPPTSTESFVVPPVAPQDYWEAVSSAVKKLAGGTSSPVLALRDKNPTEAYGVEHVDGLALVSDIGAQLGALQETGLISGEKTVALFDVGAGGVTVTIVDVPTGHVHVSRRTTVLSGDSCDAALMSFLLDRYGSGRPPTPDMQESFIELVCAAKERLSRSSAIDVDGPFPGGTVTVSRREFDDLVRNDVYDAVTLAEAMIAAGPRVDALFAVGGGANMQIVRQSLFDAVSVPVFVPVEPQLLAARGAAGTSRGFATGLAGRSTAKPRHSDSSSRHRGRLKKSRYLGGAVALLVAGGMTASAVAASNGPDQATVVDSREAVTTTRSAPAAAIVPAGAAPELEIPSLSTTLTAADTVPVAPTARPSTPSAQETATTTTRAARTTTPPTAAVTTPQEVPRDRDSTTRQAPPTSTTTVPTTTTSRPPTTTPRPSTAFTSPTRVPAG